ncbi:hypothetical protein C5Z26_00430 [Lactobacillus sp. CBA3606]|uniref:hypothetical protein n=1 Tax=Lactobacillus sp. CBA3606 TaxID=2099789 RepID=UPI000CFD4872|nr:hypothetical protein [Lactobacillus sp. CBA3606]AVK62695.1 hypothetical protein C5Z26_00430 [Lactobacillus sp. CBA3606]
MKHKLIFLVLSLMFVVFSFFTVKDYLATLPVAKDLLVALSFLILAVLNFKDSSVNANSKYDDERVSYLSDHKAIVFLEWFSFCSFVILIGIYQLINSNLIIGVIACICLLYWSLINVFKIIIYLFLMRE